MNELEIINLCNIYGINAYKINDDFSIDVCENVNISSKNLYSIPLRFRNVFGNFTCFDNKLTTLYGSPNYISGDFDCSFNSLSTLDDCPVKVDGGFYCSNNSLVSLGDSKKIVGLTFNCSHNNLKSLEGSPKELREHFDCSNNKLTSLNGSPIIVGDVFKYDNNQLPTEINANGDDIKYIIMNISDYGVFRDDNSFNSVRFEIMMNEIDL